MNQDSIIYYMKGLGKVLRSEYFKTEHSRVLQDLQDATSFGQVRSKEWILQILKEKNIKDLGQIFLCAGWYGFLAFLLLQDTFFSIKNIFLFEKDELSVKVSEHINYYFVQQEWKFKSTFKDILDINYSGDTFKTLKPNGEFEKIFSDPDTIINTSCEHIKQFDDWWGKIPTKKLVILQSNNYKELEEHVNCVSSLKEFKEKAPMNHLIYAGSLNLEKYTKLKYIRFMLIGYK